MTKFKMPMVEIFETIEGEGTRSGYVTTFVRVFGCNLRCKWCDTKYSYPPYKPEIMLDLSEITSIVDKFGNNNVCLTGGEPLMYGPSSSSLISSLSRLPIVSDLHIETNGAIDLSLFLNDIENAECGQKVRIIMDWKMPSSGEESKNIPSNLSLLREKDELKFVISSEGEFLLAVDICNKYKPKGTILFSPVFGTMHPSELAKLIIDKAKWGRLNLQQHKYIWDPEKRGV